MSDMGIVIYQQVATPITPLAPWTYAGGVGYGLVMLRLTAGKTGGNGYLPGYIPNDGALPEIDQSVDLEAGGDSEQLLTIKFQVADQMSDGQSMDAWLGNSGISLAGAAIGIYESAPIGGGDQPEPLWVGLVRSKRLTDTRLEFSCESPLDSDPLGETVSDSAIRPIVYGNALKVMLPSLPEDSATVTGLIPTTTRSNQLSDPDTTVSNWQMPGSDSACLLTYWTTLDTKRHFVDLDVGSVHPNLSQWLTPGTAAETWIVPDPSDWYIECSSGQGKDTVRRIKSGSTISIVSDLAWARDSQGNIIPIGSYFRLRIELDVPLISLEDESAICRPCWFQNPHSDGTYAVTIGPQTEIHVNILMRDNSRQDIDFFVDPTLSYFRIIQKKYKFAVPVSSNFDENSQIYASFSQSSGNTYLPANRYNDLFSISGNTLMLTPPADNISQITCYTPLTLDPLLTAVLRQSLQTGSDHVDTDRLFSMLSGGSAITQIFVDSDIVNHAWAPDTRLVFMFGNPGWDLTGVSKILFCPHFDMAYVGGYAFFSQFVNYALQAYRSSNLEIRNLPILAGTDDPSCRFLSFRTAPVSPPIVTVGAVPQASVIDTSSDWESQAVHLNIPDGFQTDLVALSVLIGYLDSTQDQLHGINPAIMHLYNFVLLAARVVSISDIYIDIPGPAYTTGTAWSARIGGAPLGPAGIPLTDGIVASEPINDHAHAYEDLFRRYLVTPWTQDPVDGMAIEQACQDLWTKTQTSLTMLPAETRPKISVAISDSSPQVGDVCAQFCRDGMLVGSRDGWGKRTVKAWLARTLLAEQDVEILESELFRGSISEAPTSPLSKLCSAPLIRYGQQAGAPTQYIQVLRPDAASWQASYTQGFPDDSTALRAWSICHRGWLETGLSQAREIRMDTIPEIDSLLALIMQPRGNTYLDWLSRPKRVLAPTIALSHAAAKLPRGSRVKLTHWKYAPTGAWGTIRRINMQPQSHSAQLEIMMDLAP